ncbi:MAG: methyltransferase [Thermoproteales archaeon]|nr:methyltransferase [Thermoproteales archaeon]
MKYEFKPEKGYVFTSHILQVIKKANNGKIKVSLDLGRTKNEIEVKKSSILLPNGCEIDFSKLDSIVRHRNRAYFVREDCDEIFEISLSTREKYYKLLVVAPDTAPTLEISGIHMHRIKKVTPLQDTIEKVKLARMKKKCDVLDICTGLGYTAIYSVKFGAQHVTTIEKDPNVLKIASYNPWSRELENEKIDIFLADASVFLKELDDKSYDRIIHDPPRFAIAGELYSLEFYKHLYRVLKPGGVLFHYTGAPGVLKGLKFQAGVASRLRRAGFSQLRILKDFGIVARKI